MASSSENILELINTSDPLVLQSQDWFNELSIAVNNLITQDFNALVQLLYRMDIPENKLRNILAASTGEATAPLIAKLLVERQLQKMAAKKFTPPASDVIPEEERW